MLLELHVAVDSGFRVRQGYNSEFRAQGRKDRIQNLGSRVLFRI